MNIDDLKAFLSVYQAGTFSKAAGTIGLTQSALSQKIKRLEDELEASLFIRHPRSLELTAAGQKLFLYAREIVQRQEEFLESFNQYQTELSGVLRIAGYSSVMRSLIIPKLASFLRNNPKVSIEFRSYEMFELSALLKSNSADIIITDEFPKMMNSESIQIGKEEYVIIKPREKKLLKALPNRFLDHTKEDNATESFFKHCGLKQDYDRAFLGDVYAIIDGVAEGLGKAVMSKHLIENDKRFLIEKSPKKYLRPIVATYLKRSYFPPLFEKTMNALK